MNAFTCPTRARGSLSLRGATPLGLFECIHLFNCGHLLGQSLAKSLAGWLAGTQWPANLAGTLTHLFGADCRHHHCRRLCWFVSHRYFDGTQATVHRTRKFSRIWFARWTPRCQAHWNWNSELLELCEGQATWGGGARVFCVTDIRFCASHSRDTKVVCLRALLWFLDVATVAVVICCCCYCSCCCWWLRIIGSHACQENASDPQPSRRQLPPATSYQL